MAKQRNTVEKMRRDSEKKRKADEKRAAKRARNDPGSQIKGPVRPAG
jgi:hypothetical protein